MEQPCHGASPVLKLVTQPSAQLPLILAIFSSFAVGDSDDADGVAAAADVRTGTMLRPTAWCFGRSAPVTCFGAATTTSGSAPVPVCDSAVPLRPSSSAADKVAIQRIAAKSDTSRK